MERKVYRFSTLFVFFIIILLFTLTPVRAEGNTFKPSEGSYKISTVEDLKNFRNSIKEATTYYDSEKKEQITVTLENDIVIGTADDIGVTTGGQFLGYFNGNGYKISGFNDNKSSFFGSLATEDQFNKSTNMPVITNFILDVDLDISFTGTKNLTKGRTYSILADSGYGKIAYCGVEGEIKASVSGVDSSSNNKRTQLIITGIDALIYSDKTYTPIENCYVNLEIDAITNSKLKNPAYFSYYGFTEDQYNVKNSYITGTVKIAETSGSGETSNSMIYGIGNIYNGVTSQAGFYDSSEGKLGSLPNIVANSGVPIKSDVTKSSSYVGFNFDSVWTTNGDTSYPLLKKNQSNLPNSTKEVQVAKKEATVDLTVKVTPKNIADIQLGGGNDVVAALKTDYTIEIGGVSGVSASDLATFINNYNLKVVPDKSAKITLNPYTTGEKVGYEGKYVSGSSVSLTYDQIKDYTLTLGKINFVSSIDGKPIQLIGNGKEETIPDEAKQAQLAGNAIKAIDICMNSFYGEGNVPDVTDSNTPWYIMTMARSGYEVPQIYYDTYYQALSTYLAGLPKDETTGYIKDYLISDYVRPLLAVTAIGYDPRNVGGVDLLAPLMDIEKIKYDKDHGNMTAEYYALIGLDACGANSDKANAARTYLVNALGTSLAADTSTAPLYDNPDMAFMMMQGVAPYYNTDANVAAGVDKLINRAKAGQNAFGGWIGFDVFNPCNIAQVIAGAASMGDNVLTDTGFIKNGYTLLDAGESYFDFENNKIFPFGGGSYGSSNLGQGQFQLPYAFEGALRAMGKSRSGSTNRLYDMTDVKNSTIAVNDAIAALPAVDTITDDTTKAAAKEKLTAVDTLLSTLTLTDTQKNSIDKTKYDAVKAKLATSTPGDADKAAAKTVTDQITALPTTDKLTITDKKAVVAARAAYVALTAAQQKLVSNLTILSEAETKIAELEAATGSDEDKAAAKTVIDLIMALPTADELTLTDKTAVAAARTAYTDLSEAQQKLVTNLTTLVAAEEKIAALESAGSEADQAAAKKVSELIAGIKAADQLKAGDKAELMKIRRAYQALTETQKGLINADVLQKLTDAEAKITELEKTVLPVKSDLDGIEVTGLPEAVKKLKVEDKKADSSVTAAAKKAAEEAGMSNVEVITLYGITPDMSVEELNQFNSDKEKYVTMTLEIPEDKRGAKSYRVYHQKSDNSSEWIDPVVSEDGIYLIFRVDSFSNFGIVAEMKAASETEDEKAAKAVTEQITALPATGSLALSDKSKVTDARAAYTALSGAGQKLVTNLSSLTAAEAKIAELEKAAASEADKAAAKKVTDQITALPAASSLALTDKSKVTDARAAYTALTDVQKALVKNLATLTAAETKITELEKIETDKAAAKKVTDQIAALGTITKWDQKVSIEAARSAYNQLSVAQKALVTTDTLNVLKAAEAAVEKLKPTTGSITIDVERFTIGQGFYVEPVTVSIKEGETARQAIEELLGAENLIGDAGYLRAVIGADTGTAAIPDYIVTKLGGGNSTAANAYGQKHSGTTLGEFDYSNYSGWYYLVNNSAPNVGMDAYTLKNGDVMRLAFTYWGYGSDLTGIEFGTNKTLVAIANKDSLLKAIAAVNANKTAYLSDETIKSAYTAAMSVAQDMTASQKATNDAATALNKAVTDSSGTDKAAAKTVTDKIAALPAVSKLALTDKAAVMTARTAYDALTTAQKALVTNLSTLTAAEAKIAELEKEAANTANKAAAKTVSDKIAALHSGTALLLGEKADVVAARIAYDALTDTQKALVTNLSTLVAAEARIAELEKETPVAKDEKTGIEAVGLPAGTAIKVGDESKDTAKTGEALKAAEKKGIKDAKVVSLFAIKPDLSDADLEKFNNDKTSYVTLTLPLSSDQQGYDSYMVYHKKSDGTVEWITPTLSADKKSLIFKVNAFSEFGVVGTKASSDPGTGSVNCTYQTQIENVGWQTEKSNGATSGTESQSLRLEGIKINVAAAGKDLGVEYQTHVQNYGWQGFKSNGTLSGTESKALRLEGIQIRLTGKDADKYDIYYRVHAQNYGWLGWAKNGESAGTEGFGYRLEAIEIKVVEKNAAAPGETKQPFITGNIHINYQTQIQNVGWQELKKDGAMSGTSGQSLRLEGIKINVENTGYDVGVSYQTHVENIGWQDLRSNGKMSGTEGESKRLEGIRISLTGNDAELCDVYYQVHAQNTGWMNWAKNGESAGTEGFGYRLEGIRIVVVPKGSPAPLTEAGTVGSAFLRNN